MIQSHRVNGVALTTGNDLQAYVRPAKGTAATEERSFAISDAPFRLLGRDRVGSEATVYGAASGSRKSSSLRRMLLGCPVVR